MDWNFQKITEFEFAFTSVRIHCFSLRLYLRSFAGNLAIVTLAVEAFKVPKQYDLKVAAHSCFKLPQSQYL